MNTSFAQYRHGLLTGPLFIRRSPQRAWRAAPALLLAAILAGCATLPPPTAELSAAQQAVSRASDADADQYAADEISTARAELSQAQAAMANGRQADARTLADVAAAGGDLAYAQSRARASRQEYEQRRREIASLREQLQLGPDDVRGESLPAPIDAFDSPATPGMRLQVLDADPQLAGLAAFERLQARQAVDAQIAARSSQRANALVIAARRVSVAELAARNAFFERVTARLDRERSDLLVEASRREADRARQEAERLRVQAQMQAEEAQRLREAADAETLARQQAEEVIIDVGGEQAARLKAARKREADLARQEAELRAAQEAAEAGLDDDH